MEFWRNGRLSDIWGFYWHKYFDWESENRVYENKLYTGICQKQNTIWDAQIRQKMLFIYQWISLRYMYEYIYV